MDDLTKSIAELLEDNWTLEASDVHKNKITFRRGEPFDLTTRFTKNLVSIEVCKLTNPVTKRTLNWSKNNEIIPVNLWMLIHPRTEAHVKDMLDNRQTIIDHIRSIIKTNQTAITDVRLGYIGRERHPDDYESETPALHSVINVTCTYLT